MAVKDQGSTDEAAVVERLRSMRLSSMAEALQAQIDDPNADLRDFMDRFSEIVGRECAYYAHRR